MKKFEVKLRECIARSGKKNPDLESMPYGFPEKVLRRVDQLENKTKFTEELWLRFGLRTLVGASLVFVALFLFHRPRPTAERLLPPPIEHSIVNFSGLL